MEEREKALKEALRKNEEQTESWTSYKKENETAVENLDRFSKHLTLDVMVPVGRKAFFPGQLIHTNEVLVGLYQGYFSKCSAFKAKEICQLRCKKAMEHLEALEKEEQLWQNKLDKPYIDGAISSGNEIDIVEEYEEEKEKLWKERHRHYVKQAKMHESLERQKLQETGKAKDKDDNEDEILNHDDVMERLEKLELMEELEKDLDLLESEGVTADTIRKLMAGEIEAPQSKIRIAHNKSKDEPNSIDVINDELIDKDNEVLQGIVKKSELNNVINRPLPTNNNSTPNPNITLENVENEADDEIINEDEISEEVITIKNQAKFLPLADQIGFYEYQIQIMREKMRSLARNKFEESIKSLEVIEQLEYLLDQVEIQLGDQELISCEEDEHHDDDEGDTELNSEDEEEDSKKLKVINQTTLPQTAKDSENLNKLNDSILKIEPNVSKLHGTLLQQSKTFFRKEENNIEGISLDKELAAVYLNKEIKEKVPLTASITTHKIKNDITEPTASPSKDISESIEKEVIPPALYKETNNKLLESVDASCSKEAEDSVQAISSINEPKDKILKSIQKEVINPASNEQSKDNTAFHEHPLPKEMEKAETCKASLLGGKNVATPDSSKETCESVKSFSSSDTADIKPVLNSSNKVLKDAKVVNEATPSSSKETKSPEAAPLLKKDTNVSHGTASSAKKMSPSSSKATEESNHKEQLKRNSVSQELPLLKEMGKESAQHVAPNKEVTCKGSLLGGKNVPTTDSSKETCESVKSLSSSDTNDIKPVLNASNKVLKDAKVVNEATPLSSKETKSPEATPLLKKDTNKSFPEMSSTKKMIPSSIRATENNYMDSSYLMEEPCTSKAALKREMLALQSKNKTVKNEKHSRKRISFASEDQTLEFVNTDTVLEMFHNSDNIEAPQRDIITLDGFIMANKEQISNDSEISSADKKQQILERVEKNRNYVTTNQSVQHFDIVSQIINESSGVWKTLYIYYKHSNQNPQDYKDEKENSGNGDDVTNDENVPGTPADFYDNYSKLVKKEKEKTAAEKPSVIYVNSYPGEELVKVPILQEKDREASYISPKTQFSISNASNCDEANQNLAKMPHFKLKSILRNKEAVCNEPHMNEEAFREATKPKEPKKKKKKSKEPVQEEQYMSAYNKVMNEVVEKPAPNPKAAANPKPAPNPKPATQPDPLPKEQFVDVHEPKKRTSRFRITSSKILNSSL